MHNLTEICVQDIVLDTNVLVHANGGGGSPEVTMSALSVLQWLAGSHSIRWVLDDQGKAAPDLSTSVLAAEYSASLPPQSFALILLSNFLASNRVSFSKRPSQATAKAIRKLLHRNSYDRAVLGAAVGSCDKVLISNDEDDFNSNVRVEVDEQFSVLILTSGEVAI